MTSLPKWAEPIEERVEKATPGKWAYIHGYGFSFHPSQDGPPTDDTVFVCHSREDIPRLLQALRLACEGLEAACFCHDEVEYDCEPCIRLEAIEKLGEGK